MNNQASIFISADYTLLLWKGYRPGDRDAGEQPCFPFRQRQSSFAFIRLLRGRYNGVVEAGDEQRE